MSRWEGELDACVSVWVSDECVSRWEGVTGWVGGTWVGEWVMVGR